MLPLTLQFFIAMIASAINERLQRKLDYALEGVRVLKEILRGATDRMAGPRGCTRQRVIRDGRRSTVGPACFAILHDGTIAPNFPTIRRYLRLSGACALGWGAMGRAVPVDPAPAGPAASAGDPTSRFTPWWASSLASIFLSTSVCSRRYRRALSRPVQSVRPRSQTRRPTSQPPRTRRPGRPSHPRG